MAGLPLWIVWIWTTLPWGVALVTVVTAAAVERLEPSWEDAARLTGVGRFRAWRALSWPLVRPSSARAAALVFVFALAEPGAPLVLGLQPHAGFSGRRGSVARAEPFPQAAVWALMTGLFGLAGWIVWRWAGGTPIVVYSTCGDTRSASSHGRPARHHRSGASHRHFCLRDGRFSAGCRLPGWSDSRIGGSRALSSYNERSLRRNPRPSADGLCEPPASAILVNSLILGLEVACATIALA